MWSHAHVEGHFISSFLYFYLLHITHALRFESLWSSRASSNMVFHFLWFICMISFVRLMDFLQITVFRTAHHSLKRIVHPKMKSQFLFCVVWIKYQHFGTTWMWPFSFLGELFVLGLMERTCAPLWCGLRDRSVFVRLKKCYATLTTVTFQNWESSSRGLCPSFISPEGKRCW